MSRYIDAERLIKRLQEWNTRDTNDKALYNFAMNRIIEQPTAYDVEKVVAKLIEKSFVDYDEYYTDGGECLISISDAIEIVREGGVE